MNSQKLLDYVHRYYHPRLAIVIGIIVSVGVLHLLGALIPLIRFVLILAIIAAVSGFLYSCGRILLILHKGERQFEGPKISSIVFGAAAIVCSVIVYALPSADENGSEVPSAAIESETEPLGPAEEAGYVTVDDHAEKITSTEKPETMDTLPDRPIIETTVSGSDGKNVGRSDTISSLSGRARRGSGNSSASGASTASASSGFRSQKSNRTSTEASENEAAMQLFGTLIQASMEQQRRQQQNPEYQRFLQSMENARKCSRCGGAGTYRYVDQTGTLQSRFCPSCNGSGRAY